MKNTLTLETIVNVLENAGYTVEHKAIVKAGETYDALVVGKEGSNVGASFHVDRLLTMDGIADVLGLVERAFENAPKADDINPDTLIANATVRLQPKSTLEDVIRIPLPPYMKDCEDKYEAVLASFVGRGIANIPLSGLGSLGVTKDELQVAALMHVMENSVCCDLNEMLGIPEDARREDIGMYCLSNKDNAFGASSIYTSAHLINIAMKHKADKLVCIPSSVHEWIVTVGDVEQYIGALHELITMVNASEIEACETLGEYPLVIDTADLFKALV